MKRIAITTLSIVLLAVSLSAKGPTRRILIRDTVRGTVTEIKDRSVLDQFNVWDGRGTFSGPPDHEVEASRGFIIDWQAGAADSRPGRLRRYEVRFFASHRNSSAEELAYVVFYENDPSTGRGYVYLPGRSDEHFRLNVQSIHRGDGLEGHWLHASSAWQTAIAKLQTLQ
jgi:hypothetical protein